MIPFVKMQGIGNDFVLLDGIGASLPSQDLGRLSVEICDRRLGIGADGLILLERGTDHPLRMRMFNPDGSESEMCGNGLRCFGKLAWDRGYVDEGQAQVETGAGVLEIFRVAPDRFRVDMGVARRTAEQPIDLGRQGLQGVAISMGNPHLAVLVQDVEAVPLEEWGPELERHPAFPHRTNVHFVQVLDRGHLRQRTWERGAGATLACGTGACAGAAAAIWAGLADARLENRLPGGTLEIELAEADRVYLTGPAETVFEGTYSPK